MMPPMGRTAKPTPKVRNESRVPTTGSLLGKNNSPNTSAALGPRAISMSLRCAREIVFLGRRLRLVDGALTLRRRQRHAHRHVRQPRRNHRRPCQQPAVELLEILDARQRPSVACGNFVEQEVARTTGSV